MQPVSYQFFIFNQKFRSLHPEDSNDLDFIRTFEEYLPQINSGVEIQFDNNEVKQVKVESCDLRSIDKKWKICFQMNQILIMYNHAYPDDNFSILDFKNEVIKLIEKIKNKFLFDSCNRLGFIQSAIESKEERINEFCKENDQNTRILLDKSVQKVYRITPRIELKGLEEKFNFLENTNFSENSKLKTITNETYDVNGLHYMYDINTLTENLTPRFNLEHIELFLSNIENILGEQQL